MSSDLRSCNVSELSDALLRHPDLGHMGSMVKPQFFLTVATTPIANVELAIVDDHNRFLLTYRNDPDFHGWHFPGGIILQFDSVFTTCRRIAHKEFGVNSIKNITLAGLRNYNDRDLDQRHFDGMAVPNHFVGLVMVAQLGSRQVFQIGKFFARAPKEILVSHRKTFTVARRYVRTGRISLTEDLS